MTTIKRCSCSTPPIVTNGDVVQSFERVEVRHVAATGEVVVTPR